MGRRNVLGSCSLRTGKLDCHPRPCCTGQPGLLSAFIDTLAANAMAQQAEEKMWFPKMSPDRTYRREMVGTTGFEPATSRTPSVRATRLRYVPTVFCSPRLLP